MTILQPEIAQNRLGVKGTDANGQNQYLKQKMALIKLIYINLN